MAETTTITSPQAKQEIAQAVCAVFGNGFSKDCAEEWVRMLIDEASPSSYKDYAICVRDGELHFSQHGEKEYYHDGSTEAYKYIRIKPISEDDYIAAKAHRCEPESAFHEYTKGWLNRGEECFLTVWVGRYADYLYYAKNIAGVPYVKITIESGY